MKQLPWLFVFFLLIPGTCRQSAASADQAAEIVSITGLGEYRLEAAGSWNGAGMGQNLFAGNEVRTGRLSRMGLLFSDRSQVRLNESTLLRVKSIRDSQRKQGKSILRLEKGRAWTQSREVPEGLIMETPSATAAIRGTDWDLEVDENGAALITVLSGEVTFYNDFGQVVVQKNEQAHAEIGRAPVKRIIVRPSDRVQWVTAYRVNPFQHISFDDKALAIGEETELAVLGKAALEILEQDLYSAVQRLETLILDPALRQPAAYLILSDIMIYTGDMDRAIDLTEQALVRFPGSPRAYSQLARLYLVLARPEASDVHIQHALASDPQSYHARIVQGELAYIQGDSALAQAAYREAAALKSDDGRAWYGLGVILSELEKIHAARAALKKALERNPDGPGYQGELGTMETFANNFKAAGEAFSSALESDPSDYVTLTGLGLICSGLLMPSTMPERL